MQKRAGFLTVFILFLLLSSVVFYQFRDHTVPFAGKLGEDLVYPLQRTLYSAFGGLLTRSDDTEKMRSEYQTVVKQLVDQRELEKETKALRDQYDLEVVPSKSLLPARVIGMKSFIPGVSLPEEVIIDKGSLHHVAVGQTVVQTNNLVGSIVAVTKQRSLVRLLSNREQSLAAKAVKTSALGVIHGQGNGGLILENVVLSDTLEKGDVVITKGDQDLSGKGFPPDLVIGKIRSVDKKTSDLFQTAEVESLIDFARLDRVFVITN